MSAFDSGPPTIIRGVPESYPSVMPKLSSGRCVALSPVSLLPRLLDGTDEAVYANIVAFRLSVPDAKSMRGILPILYCDDARGTPTEENCTRSRFIVADVESGRCDWSEPEVTEFVNWLDTNSDLSNWLEHEYATVNKAIAAHPIWTSKFAGSGA